MHTALTIPTIALACLLAPGKPTEPMHAAQLSTRTNADGVIVHPVYHSSLALVWNERTILVDPHDGAFRYTSFAAPDLILITDIHGDHMDPATLLELDLRKARIVAPKAVVDQLPQVLKARATVLANGEKIGLEGIGIEAIPMYNMPDPDDPRHPKGRGNGYVLTLVTERVYISGDTEDIPEMRALTDIDIAFVCMNLPYTMTVDQAASGVLAFKPRVVYPYHYRGKEGFSDVERFRQLVEAGNREIQVRLEDWYKE